MIASMLTLKNQPYLKPKTYINLTLIPNSLKYNALYFYLKLVEYVNNLNGNVEVIPQKPYN